MVAGQNYYKSLSGLRGIGAVWVTLFHVFYGSKNEILSAGYLGVDLFFLLSGFIISHVHNSDFVSGYTTKAHRRFLQLRLIRIYPLHVFVLALFGLFVLIVPSFALESDHPERFGLVPFLQSMLLIHNWGFFSPTRWNIPTWSLSVEWLAYLVFPLISIGVARVKPKYSLLYALFSLAALEIVLAVAGANRADMGKVGLLRIGFEFLAGCFVYRYSVWDSRKNTVLLLWLALPLLFLAIYVPSTRLLAPTSFALLILSVVSGRNIVARSLSTTPLLFLGDISFSLYMCHSPLIQIEHWILKAGYLAEGSALATLIAAICVATVGCCKYIETPARIYGRRLLAGSELSHHGKQLNRSSVITPDNVGSKPTL